jgi:hypothetical protein
MTPENKQEIKKLIIQFAGFYDHKLNETRIQIFAEVLGMYKASDIKRVMYEFMHDGKIKLMPLPGEIISRINPSLDPEAEAKEAASRIQAAVTKFGWPNATEAEAFIGEAGWHAVQRWGGWSHLCQNLGVSIDVTTFHAQAREVIKTEMKRRDMGIAHIPPMLTNGPTKASDILKHIFDNNKAFLPEGEK